MPNRDHHFLSMFNEIVLATVCTAGFGIVVFLLFFKKKMDYDSEKQLVSATFTVILLLEHYNCTCVPFNVLHEFPPKVDAKHIAFLENIRAQYAVKFSTKFCWL
jgi:hypothetical protein